MRRLEAEAAAAGDDDFDDDGEYEDEEDDDDLADMDAGSCADDEDIDEAAEAALVEQMEAEAGSVPARVPAPKAKPVVAARRATTATAAASSSRSMRPAASVAGYTPPASKPGHMQFWDLNNFKRLHAGKRVCIIGGTTCGKTTALYEIAGAMHRNEKRREQHKAEKARASGSTYKAKRGGVQFAVGFSKTENANGNLGGPVRNDDGDIKHQYSIMPSFCATHGFDEKKLADFMQYQIDTKSYGRMKTSLVIMDDIMSQKGVKNSAVLNEFMQNARNYGCGLIQGQHSVKQSSVDSRTQFHYVVCYEIAADQMKAFYDVFASRVFPTFKKFRETWMLMNRKLGQYWALVIDVQNSANSSRIEDRVFKFKAQNPDRDGYKIPHLCELGCWWIDRNLSKANKNQASLRELFDLSHIAQQHGIDLNQPALPMAQDAGEEGEEGEGTAAAPEQVAAGAGAGVESIVFDGHGRQGGGTVLEPAPSSFELRV